MGFVFYNPNPSEKFVGDCVIRGISKVEKQSWEDVYIGVSVYGLFMCDMPSSNAVWGAYLKSKGYVRHTIPDTCPDCYSVSDFARDHKKGAYLLATGAHVVAVCNGDYYDAWDSGREIPIYYWVKED